jgi:predicted nucleic acid-binding protein
LPLKRAAIRYVLNTALAIGLKHKLAIYDSLYIALAQRTESVFVTIDAKQEKAATIEEAILKPISDFT